MRTATGPLDSPATICLRLSSVRGGPISVQAITRAFDKVDLNRHVSFCNVKV